MRSYEQALADTQASLSQEQVTRRQVLEHMQASHSAELD
ncbi:hypothetical protein L249_7913 [Ophiocordyceps polyrhachis-furcata BCC 54312]|uniref:Uncharacterized protein n=1 Tax=Ophiocordyceps polyrhachis-furcata BCC 54312 TaxID=1330021 RepID=A0A367LI65_9HYPO|nr:hypothetical protein L249_7913 [Ophiocordyceps polyrhachis-furcata BCC 54312]